MNAAGQGCEIMAKVRKRIFLLAKTAITCINGVKFEAPQQLKFFPSIFGTFFSRKMCLLYTVITEECHSTEKNESIKIIANREEFCVKTSFIAFAFFDLVTKS